MNFINVYLDRSCNTLVDLSDICVRSKTEDVNLYTFNMITGINKSKTVTKHILCDCKCKFDDIQFNSSEKWNDVIN